MTELTSKELWQQQAPNHHFELNEEKLLKKALDVGFVTKVEGKEDAYLVNENYNVQ